MSQDGVWVRSPRLGDAGPLDDLLGVLGQLRDAAQAGATAAEVLAAIMEAQALIESVLQQVSSRRAVGLAVSEVIRQLVEPLLTDGLYLTSYSNLGSLIERVGIGPVLRAQSLGVPVEQDAFNAGLYASFPERPYSYSNFVPNQRRQAGYLAQNLTETVRFREFDAWLAPVLEAMYDPGDPRRPRAGAEDRLGALVLTVEGVDPVAVYEQFAGLARLMSSPIPFLDLDNLRSILEDDDDEESTTRRRRPRHRLIQDLGIYGIDRSRVVEYSSRPDFARLSTADLLPPLGDALNGLFVGANIIGPRVPITFGLEGVTGILAQTYGRLVETLDRAVRSLQTITDVLKLSGVSRLWVPTETGGVDGLVARIQEASATRNDFVRVLSNAAALTVDGTPSADPLRLDALPRGYLVREAEARQWKSAYPSFTYGPADNLIIMGVCMVMVEGPLYRLMESLFRPTDDEAEVGLSRSRDEVNARLNPNRTAVSRTAVLSRIAPQRSGVTSSRWGTGADPGVRPTAAQRRDAAASMDFGSASEGVRVPGVGGASRAGASPSIDPASGRVQYTGTDCPSNADPTAEITIAGQAKVRRWPLTSESELPRLGITSGYAPAGGVTASLSVPMGIPAPILQLSEPPGQRAGGFAGVVRPGGGEVESAELAAYLLEHDINPSRQTVHLAVRYTSRLGKADRQAVVRMTSVGTAPNRYLLDASIPAYPSAEPEVLLSIKVGTPTQHIGVPAARVAGAADTLAVCIALAPEVIDFAGDELAPDLEPTGVALQLQTPGLILSSDGTDWPTATVSNFTELDTRIEVGESPTYWPSDLTWVSGGLPSPADPSAASRSFRSTHYAYGTVGSPVAGQWSLLSVQRGDRVVVGLGLVPETSTNYDLGPRSNHPSMSSAEVLVLSEGEWVSVDAPLTIYVAGPRTRCTLPAEFAAQHAGKACVLLVDVTELPAEVRVFPVAYTTSTRSRLLDATYLRYVPSETGYIHSVRGECFAETCVFGGDQDAVQVSAEAALLRYPARADLEGYRNRRVQVWLDTDRTVADTLIGTWVLLQGPDWELTARLEGLNLELRLVAAGLDESLRIAWDRSQSCLYFDLEFDGSGTSLSAGWVDRESYPEKPAELRSTQTEIASDLRAFPWANGVLLLGRKPQVDEQDSSEWASSGIRLGSLPFQLIGLRACVIEDSE